jgi:hypothetical protein
MFSRNLTSRQIMNAVWALGASSTFEACVERPIVIEQPHAWYLLTFPVRFDVGFLNFGMRITALSIRFGCLGVLVYPKQPRSRLRRSRLPVGRWLHLVFSPSNGVLAFIPGVYQQFQPSSESHAILTILSDDRP